MKNENKIIELLTEYISRTDSMEREFKQEILGLRKSDVALKKEQVNLKKELVDLRKESNQRDARQEALMKEIFRISRRVSDIEDKN